MWDPTGLGGTVETLPDHLELGRAFGKPHAAQQLEINHHAQPGRRVRVGGPEALRAASRACGYVHERSNDLRPAEQKCNEVSPDLPVPSGPELCDLR